MHHPMHSILPADYLRAFNDDDETEPTCLFCFKWKEDDEAIYCSRKCAVSHTLLKLTGGKTTREDWDYLENYVDFLYDSQCINVQTAPEPIKPVAVASAASQTHPVVTSSASARLFERLSEMGKLDDELTINGLIETLEYDDTIDDSGESSLTRSLGQELVDVLPDDDTWFAQRSIEGNNELASAVNQDDAETDYIVEYGVDAEPSHHSALDDLSAEELEEMKHLGLASRLRMIYAKTGTFSKRVVSRAQSGKKPPTAPPPSPVVIPEPSGDGWDDFLHIQRFLDKSGLGGQPNKSSR